MFLALFLLILEVLADWEVVSALLLQLFPMTTCVCSLYAVKYYIKYKLEMQNIHKTGNNPYT